MKYYLLAASFMLSIFLSGGAGFVLAKPFYTPALQSAFNDTGDTAEPRQDSPLPDTLEQRMDAQHNDLRNDMRHHTEERNRLFAD